MRMQTIRSSTLCLVVMLLVAPLLRAQDLSKYRSFSFGMSPAECVEADRHEDRRCEDPS